jgi:5'-nucleotidase
MASESSLTIVHFNDVYNIEPQKTEPLGGAARLAGYIKSIQHLHPMVLFSGDALNPSLRKSGVDFKQNLW